MNPGYFITGTDTGVGKTMLTAVLLSALRAQGHNAMIMKPVQSGCEPSDHDLIATDPLFCLERAGMDVSDIDWEQVCPYRLRMPASPHLAARQEGVTVDPSRILQSVQYLQALHAPLLVEGAGGALVPITPEYSMLDLMADVGLPILVAARAGLGTINHTLLTLQALQARNFSVAGVVLIQSTPGPWGAIEEDNEQILARNGYAPVWGHIRYVENPSAPGMLESAMSKNLHERVNNL